MVNVSSGIHNIPAPTDLMPIQEWCVANDDGGTGSMVLIEQSSDAMGPGLVTLTRVGIADGNKGVVGNSVAKPDGVLTKDGDCVEGAEVGLDVNGSCGATCINHMRSGGGVSQSPVTPPKTTK